MSPFFDDGGGFIFVLLVLLLVVLAAVAALVVFVVRYKMITLLIQVTMDHIPYFIERIGLPY